MIDIRSMPIFLDGSDGSMWASRDTWDKILIESDLSSRRFVRISDLLLWLETNNYPMMDLKELLELSLVATQHAGKLKQESAALALSLAKTGLFIVPTGPLTENNLPKSEGCANEPDGPSLNSDHAEP